MTSRLFPIFNVRRADFGPRVPAARITCARCGATDEVVLGDRGCGAWIDKKFAAAGWSVGANENRDLCSACGGVAGRAKTGLLPMVKASPPAAAPVRSADAILAGKVAYDLMFEHLDFDVRRYLGGWSDERVAEEAKLSLKAVVDLRKERFFDLAPPPEEPLRTIAKAVDGDLLALRGAVEAVGLGLRAVSAALEVTHKAELRLFAAEAALLDRAGNLHDLSTKK